SSERYKGKMEEFMEFQDDELARIDSLIDAIHSDYIAVAYWTKKWRESTLDDKTEIDPKTAEDRKQSLINADAGLEAMHYHTGQLQDLLSPRAMSLISS